MEDDIEDCSNSILTPELSVAVGLSDPVVRLQRLDLQRYLCIITGCPKTYYQLKAVNGKAIHILQSLCQRKS